MDSEPQRVSQKEGRRLRALRACFHRALRLALDCSAWEVRSWKKNGHAEADSLGLH